VLDFTSTIVFKLTEIKPEEGLELVQPMLLDDEKIFAAFKGLGRSPSLSRSLSLSKG
jgi:hypothetical protein